MCDPATGLFEVIGIRNKKSKRTVSLLDQTWHCCYPHPRKCISDNGNAFLGKEFQELLQSNGVKSGQTTVNHSQANFVESMFTKL